MAEENGEVIYLDNCTFGDSHWWPLHSFITRHQKAAGDCEAPDLTDVRREWPLWSALPSLIPFLLSQDLNSL